MSTFNQGMRMGAGLIGLGWGIYRLSRGKRDWITTASMTTGTSMVIAALTRTRTQSVMERMLDTAAATAPRMKGMVNRMVPQALTSAGEAAMNLMQ